MLAGIFAFRSPNTAADNVIYEYKQITTIESVVPGGLGRSRMVTTDPDGNYKEQDMENFFSLVGINFGNVRKNDKIITDQINHMETEGWILADVNSGVYSADKSTGIFITRYLFKKSK
ncbi:MAG: hypothetical protein IT242_01965 [Bacteroidia bacterium]|nr:hypothetical protein [Bacteroidia bacterium]